VRPKPDPVPGLIVRYDYLWRDQQAAGQQQGSKERPSAIITASLSAEGGDHIVLICAISHEAPENDSECVRIPAKVAKYLGLDDRPQWIRTSEYNEVLWSDPGIVPARADQWEYGRMPIKLYQAMRESILGHHKRHQKDMKINRK